MGCHPAIAATIVAGEADYLLALKGNPPAIHEAVTLRFAEESQTTLTRAETVEKGHGRIERRTCWASDDPIVIRDLDPERRWAGRRSVAMVMGETQYVLSSLSADAERLARAVRAHWGIENQVQWVRDGAFREDACRVRCGSAAEILPCCAIWRSICYARSARPRSGSKPSASCAAGMRPSSSPSVLFDLRLP